MECCAQRYVLIITVAVRTELIRRRARRFRRSRGRPGNREYRARCPAIRFPLGTRSQLRDEKVTRTVSSDHALSTSSRLLVVVFPAIGRTYVATDRRVIACSYVVVESHRSRDYSIHTVCIMTSNNSSSRFRGVVSRARGEERIAPVIRAVAKLRGEGGGKIRLATRIANRELRLTSRDIERTPDIRGYMTRASHCCAPL